MIKVNDEQNFEKKRTLVENKNNLKKRPKYKMAESHKNIMDIQLDEKKVKKFINFEINILDTGIGISKEGIEKLFVNFGKLSENSSQNKSGTGLGLSICK